METFVWQGGRTGGLQKSRPGEVRLVFGLVITMRTERGMIQSDKETDRRRGDGKGRQGMR